MAETPEEVPAPEPKAFDLFSLDPARLDEFAKNDPFTISVNAILDKVPTIRQVRYLSRLVDTIVFVGDMVRAYHANKPRFLQRKMAGVESMNLGQYLQPEADQRAVEFMAKVMQVEFERTIGRYEPWMLNQGLVMCCTILDVFLEHAVEVITTVKPQMLYESDDSKEIHLKRVIELNSVEAVVSDVRQKVLRKFSFGSIEKRLGQLERRYKIPQPKLFDWSAFFPEAVEKFKGWGSTRLIAIYEDRHLIVHADRHPITSLDDLEVIKDFFEKIILNITRLTTSVHDIRNDLGRAMAMAQVVEQLRKEPKP